MKKIINKSKYAIFSSIAMLQSSKALAQSDPFAAFEEAGNSFLDSIQAPIIILATISLIIMGIMLAIGRLQWPVFTRLAAGVLIIGLAPAMVNWLINAVS